MPLQDIGENGFNPDPVSVNYFVFFGKIVEYYPAVSMFLNSKQTIS